MCECFFTYLFIYLPLSLSLLLFLYFFHCFVCWHPFFSFIACTFFLQFIMHFISHSLRRHFMPSSSSFSLSFLSFLTPFSAYHDGRGKGHGRQYFRVINASPRRSPSDGKGTMDPIVSVHDISAFRPNFPFHFFLPSTSPFASCTQSAPFHSAFFLSVNLPSTSPFPPARNLLLLVSRAARERLTRSTTFNRS